MLIQSIVTFLAAVGVAQSVPIEARAIVPHDSIWPFAEYVPPGATGNVAKMFEPYLHIASGCQPYTAVNWEGDTSGGLQDTGSATGGCRDDRRGQTYVRTTWHNGRFAIMYAWYFPKDMSADGISTGAHRHDWENVVIWIDNPAKANPTLIGGAASGHGNYKKTTNPQRQGTRPKVEYFSNFPTNKELQFTNTLGRDYPMVHWDTISQAARNGLQNANFGSANVPFKDGNFLSNLDKAAI